MEDVNRIDNLGIANVDTNVNAVINKVDIAKTANKSQTNQT